MKDKKEEWYVIPPYKNEGWQIFNEKGEYVASFENKEDCILTVKLYEEYTRNKNNSKVVI